MAERLKSWFVPRSCGGCALTAFLVLLVCVALVSSFRDDLYRTYLGLQPDAQNVGPTAYAAGERPGLEETAGGAKVTVESVYAEEEYVVIGYQVEDLSGGRRVGEHPAELQPLLGFAGDKKEFEDQSLGTNTVELTDAGGTDFRMVDNSGEVSEGPDNMGHGPLQNMAAFRPERGLEPGEKHSFRFRVPIVESPVVGMGEKMPPPEPFESGPFVFEFEAPVRDVSVVDVGYEATAEDVTLTLDRVINSPGRPQAVVCYDAPDDEHSWLIWGGRGVHEGGWGSGGMKGIESSGCQTLELNGPLEGRSSFEVASIEGMRTCPPKDKDCFPSLGDGPTIQGPWRFEFEVPDP